MARIASKVKQLAPLFKCAAVWVARIFESDNRQARHGKGALLNNCVLREIDGAGDCRSCFCKRVCVKCVTINSQLSTVYYL